MQICKVWIGSRVRDLLWIFLIYISFSYWFHETSKQSISEPILICCSLIVLLTIDVANYHLQCFYLKFLSHRPNLHCRIELRAKNPINKYQNINNTQQNNYLLSLIPVLNQSRLFAATLASLFFHYVGSSPPQPPCPRRSIRPRSFCWTGWATMRPHFMVTTLSGTQCALWCIERSSLASPIPRWSSDQHDPESQRLVIVDPGGFSIKIIKLSFEKLIASVLNELYAEPSFVENTLVVRLDGFIDTDDGIALKSATQQMQLDNVVAGKVFGSYAENLSFLLACLRSGQKDESKSVIFILDHFDRFCAHPKQALLYNLFDIVQSAQAPLCVVGLTCRQDVLELLEKRVKSRFSHRQISLFPGDRPFAEHLTVYKKLLQLPMSKVRLVYKWIKFV